ncbi:MAG TPA: hypothetical protein VKZ45_07445 [Vicingaceae bacterium]|nr:hypothetical protein [Vicingaceae bacterium]
MKELHNHIFSATSCITKEAMMKYINHQLTKAELHQVEKHLLDCDLCSEAMEGMKYARNSSVLFAIDHKIDERVAAGNTNPFFKGGWLMAAASVVAIIFGAYFLINLWNENQLDQMAVNQKANEETATAISEENYIKKETAEPAIDQTIVDPTIEEVNTKSQEKIVAQSDIPPSVAEKEDYRGTPQTIITEDEVEEEPEFFANEMPASKEEATGNALFESNNTSTTTADNNFQGITTSMSELTDDEDAGRKENVAKKKDKTNRSKAYEKSAPAPSAQLDKVVAGNTANKSSELSDNAYYWNNYYKLVDYTVEYQNEEDFKKAAESDATPADYVSKEQKAEAEKQANLLVVEETYVEVLDRAMTNFKNTDYKAALQDYDLILSKHPEDVNALFYGGLSAFQLKNYTQALKNFSEVLINKETTFHQEAKWHQSLTQIALGKNNEAKKNLQEIVKEKGFYAEKAVAKLKELE